MDERQEKLIQAAISTFTRYGVRRTTMADIASAAGVSRQTLYASFSNKDDVLVAVIDAVCETAIAGIKNAWAEAPTLSAKLDAFFDIGVVQIYDQVQSAPDAEDIVTGFSPAGREAQRRSQDLKSRALCEMLDPYSPELAQLGQTPEKLADFIEMTVTGFYSNARDRQHLMQLLDALKATVLHAVDARESTAAEN